MPDLKLPALDLTEDLNEIARLAGGDDVDDLLRRGLEWVGKLAAFDLASVFVLAGDRLVLRAAHGPLADPKLIGHALALSAFPSVQEAIAARKARAFVEADHAHGDGDPFDGVLDLPHGHACMVVPLAAGDDVLGVLTLDRKVCETYAEPVVRLVELFARILALAVLNAGRAAALARLERQARSRADLLDAELAAPTDDALESSACPAMREVVRRARQVAPTRTPVLILGETGTGKERLARAIHRWSGRGARPFVKLNCAAVPEGLMESELFGHQKGAFTGAAAARLGRFQTADGGTLLLDEIGELPLDLQAKLLRVLQEGEFEPVGSDRTVKVDVRVIAATHVDLERAVVEKRVREDLRYRLDVFPLRVPPLRERREDLPRLVDAVLAEQAARTGRRGMKVEPAAFAKLAAYDWPGNVRELANVLERATILAPTATITADLVDVAPRPRVAAAALDPDRTAPEAPAPFSTTSRTSPTAGASLTSMDEAQREQIRRALAAAGGRVYGKGGAAELLGMKPSTLQSRMKKLGVAKPS
jgi:formate hydrogenlyase transcriptional activator